MVARLFRWLCQPAVSLPDRLKGDWSREAKDGLALTLHNFNRGPSK
jgi:hypothetical protein